MRIIFLALVLLSACATKTVEPTVSKPVDIPVAKELYQKILPAIYEVVIVKPDESRVTFDKPLPDSVIPYQERNDKYRSIGTAFAIGQNQFVSAAHVFPFALDTGIGKYFLRDQAGQVYEVSTFTRYSNYRDLVEFQVSNPPAENAYLKFASKIEIGDNAINIGNALGQGISLRGGGQISSFTPEEVANQWKFIRFSSPASHGNSGGPLLNEQGEVFGVVTMGIPGEQLNFAVPIEELGKISKTEAEFSLRQERFERGRETMRKSWSSHAPLPANVARLSEDASSSLRKFSEENWRTLFKRGDERFFPANPKFQTYSHFQTVRSGIGFLEQMPSGDWRTEYPKLHSTNYKPETSLKWYESKKTFYFVIERPSDVNETDFMGNPQGIFDLVAPIFEIGQNIYGTKRMIKSLGKPDTKREFRDDIGRAWTHAEWNIPRVVLVDQYCSATPRGAVCGLFILPPMSSSLAIDIPLQRALDEIVWSYTGSLKEWQAFFKLKKDLLPKYFEDANLSIAKDSVKIKLPKRTFNYAAAGVQDESELTMKTGYTPGPDGSVGVIDISLKTDKDVQRNVFTEKFFEPATDNSKKAREVWSDIEGKKHHFDGAIHKRDQWSQVEIPLEKVKEKNGNFWLTALCNRGEDESTEGLVEACQEFAKQNK